MTRVIVHYTLKCFLIGSLLFCPLSTTAQDNNSSDWKPYLDKMSGMWTLTADMGSRELHQQCEGEWILQQQFFRFQCEAVAPDTSRYESIYFITYNSEKTHYVFHLFDVYGGAYSETLGFGTLKGNRLTFDFNYPGGLFQNIFVWNEDDESWKMILRQKTEKNSWKLFAEKKLTKMTKK